MEPINLLKKYRRAGIKSKFNQFKKGIRGYSETNESLGLRKGDIVEFTGGYHDDTKFITMILGFNIDGKAYMLWDCYWYDIDLSKRLVRKID